VGARDAVHQIVVDTTLKGTDADSAHLDIVLQINDSAEQISETIQF
jgi:hypothetical protein